MAIYACADLHGRLDLLRQIQDFLKLDDTVYFLGDAGDRGPNPWDTIKAVAEDPRFIYLKGNHEDMLVKAMEDDIKYDHLRSDNFYLLISNGGDKTFSQWEIEENKRAWWDYLRKLPTYKKYINANGYTIHLSHAGFNPKSDGTIPNDDDLLWDREHTITLNPAFGENEICVHGHTPIPLLIKTVRRLRHEEIVWDGAFWYANNHKVDLDCASWYTGQTVLLDLDSFDEHIFTDAV